MIVFVTGADLMALEQSLSLDVRCGMAFFSSAVVHGPVDAPTAVDLYRKTLPMKGDAHMHYSKHAKGWHCECVRPGSSS